MRQHKAEAWTKWRGLVAKQNQSGQNLAAFCRELGLWDALMRYLDDGRIEIGRVEMWRGRLGLA